MFLSISTMIFVYFTYMYVSNPYAAELFVSIFRHLKLELLTQFPASSDEK